MWLRGISLHVCEGCLGKSRISRVGYQEGVSGTPRQSDKYSVCVLSCFSHVSLQPPLCMEFSRQEYGNVLP